MNNALELIAEERERQISKEGWTAEHDDEHADQELASAAACYALPDWLRYPNDEARVPSAWPFEESSWKPSPQDRIRELVKAGALIVAEIERLQRKDPNA